MQRFWNIRKTLTGIELVLGNMTRAANKALGIEFDRTNGVMKALAVRVRVHYTDSKPQRVLFNFGVSTLNGDVKFFCRRRKGIRK